METTTAQPSPLFSDEYDRYRREPAPGDPLYLHLKDLADALRPRLERARGIWLDFGSGTSPYRQYAKNVAMKLADIPDEGTVRPPDYVLEPDRPCPAADEAFDGVLSTQVLEHLPDPGYYLRDALRMLRPGGELLLTTHGIWEDHPCPLDMSRWTAQGLRELVSQAGFEVVECVPLTCGARGTLLLFTKELLRMRWRRRFLTPLGLLIGVLRLLARHKPHWLDSWADRWLGDQSAGVEGRDKLYLELVLTARKPG